MAIRTATTLNLPRKQLAAGEKRLAEFKAEQMRPRTALERLVEEGPVSLKDQPNYIQRNPEAYLARPQDLTDPAYYSSKPGELEAQQEAREQWARNVEMREIQDEAERENIARDQRELERQEPIGDERYEILMDPDQRDPSSPNFAWKGEQDRLQELQQTMDSWTPEQQLEADLLAQRLSTINTLLADGFGQSIQRGDLLVKAFHQKINEQDVIAAGKVDYEGAAKDYAGTDVKMAYSDPVEADRIMDASWSKEWGELGRTLLNDDNYRTTEPVDAPPRTPAGDKAFTDYLMQNHPETKWNPLALKGLLFNPEKFNAGIYVRPSQMGLSTRSDKPHMMVDPNFLRIMNYVIEKHIFQQQFVPIAGEYEYDLMEAGVLRPAQMDLFDQDNPSSREGPEQGMYTTKTAGSGKLGREIFKEWWREVNRSRGQATDAYNLNSVTDDEYEALGAFAREVWQSVNPDLYTTDQTGDLIKYKLTSKGREALKQAALSAPDAFKTQEIPPTRISEAELGGRRTGEARRSRETTQIIKPEKPHRIIEEGRNGMESFGHQVATKRTKLFYQVGLQAMINAKGQSDLTSLGDLVKLGPEKMLAFQGEFNRKAANKADKQMMDLETAEREVAKEYDPRYEMDKQFTRFIEALNTLARYSDGLWKLKFAHQGLTSRMHVIQTRFNPQGNPWIRFATGGATPTIFSPKNNSEENNVFKELMSTMFIPGGKKATPEKRIELFNNELKKLDQPDSILATVAAEGQTVEESLMDNDTYKATTESLKGVGLAVNPQQQQKQMFNPETNQYETATSTADYIRVPEELAQVPPLNIPDSLLARTRDKSGASEDLDGLHKIEAAMELKRYLDALKNGTQFSTDINVEFDGKTHGIASYLASLGNLKAAYRTGITREAGAGKNLDKVPAAQLAGVEGQVFTLAAFNIKELGEGTFDNIKDAEGKPARFDGARYDGTNNTIYISKDDLMKKWEDKAWTKPRKQSDKSTALPIAKDAFKTFEEFVEFVKFHESMHARKMAEPRFGRQKEVLYSNQRDPETGRMLPKRDADGDLQYKYTESIGDYETRINKAALKEFQKYKKMLSQQEVAEKEGDIRDAVGYYMLENGREYAYNGYQQTDANTERLYRILELAIDDKESFLKQPIMTLSYGRIIRNLGEEVTNTIHTGKNSFGRTINGEYHKGIKDLIAEMEASGDVKLVTTDAGGYETTFKDTADVVKSFLHNMMADGINSELHPGVQAVGQALRATNVVAMLSNGIMSMNNALGVPNYIGAKETKARIDPVTGNKVLSDIAMVTSRTNPQTGKPVTVKGIAMAEAVPSGSALRDGQLGGWGRGRIIPAIIQAMDGAWMNMMFRGGSFEKIKDGYALPIFDAVKTDIKTAATVRREANKNWWNVVNTYKPWRSLFIDWTDKQLFRYEKELQQSIDAGDVPINFEAVNRSLQPFFRAGLAATIIKDPELPIEDNPNQERIARKEEERVIIGNKAKKELDQFKPYYLLLHANSSKIIDEPTNTTVRMGDLHLSTLAQLLEDTMPFRPKELGETIDKYDKAKRKEAYKQARWIVRGPILDRMKAAQDPGMTSYSPQYWRGAQPLQQIKPSEMRAIFRRIISVLKIKAVEGRFLGSADDLRTGNTKRGNINLDDKGQFNLSDVYKPRLNEAMVASIEGSFKEYIKNLPPELLRLLQIDMG